MKATTKMLDNVITIRPFDTADFDGLVKLRGQQQESALGLTNEYRYKDFEKNMLSFLQDAVYDKDYWILVAEDDGRIISMLSFRTVKEMPGFFTNSGCAYISDYYTLPEYKNKGVFDRMMEETENILRGRNIVKKVWL